MKTVIIVPCYNEEKRLNSDAFLSALSAQPGLSVLFVNDGSADRTRAKLQDLRDQAPQGRVDVLTLEQNSGKAEAVRRGVLAAFENRADQIGYWDADLATPLAEIPRLASVLQENSSIDLVLGSRVRLLGRHVERKPHRHAYGRVFATVVSTILGIPVWDTQCGAKVFRATPEIRSAFERPFMSRWVFDVELLARLVMSWHRQGMLASDKIMEQPLMRWTDVAGSKLGLLDAVRAFYELARIEKHYGPRLRGR